MKLDIILVDFALVALVFIPYFSFILISYREERKLKRIFSEEALKHQLKPEEKDRWNNNLVGLDKNKLMVLFVQKRKSGVSREIIDLKEVKTCEILQETYTVKIDTRTENVLQRIDLHFQLYNNSTKVVNLFNCDETFSQDYELKHAEKWKNKINSLLSFRPTLNSAA